MARDDPFTGIRLSEQASTAPGRIEQRLFSPEPTPPVAAPEKPPGPPKPEPAKPVSPKPTAKPNPASAGNTLLAKPRSLTTRFDLDDQPLFKASYLFTQEELEALEDLKLEMRRELDTKVTKNDLARCAFHFLLDDYAANHGQSYVKRKLRERRGR